jgi:hypothetical protein
MAGDLWTYEERETLRRLALERRPAGDVARELGRTYDAVRKQAKRLGLELPN